MLFRNQTIGTGFRMRGGQYARPGRISCKETWNSRAMAAPSPLVRVVFKGFIKGFKVQGQLFLLGFHKDTRVRRGVLLGFDI